MGQHRCHRVPNIILYHAYKSTANIKIKEEILKFNFSEENIEWGSAEENTKHSRMEKAFERNAATVGEFNEEKTRLKKALSGMVLSSNYSRETLHHVLRTLAGVSLTYAYVVEEFQEDSDQNFPNLRYPSLMISQDSMIGSQLPNLHYFTRTKDDRCEWRREEGGDDENHKYYVHDNQCKAAEEILMHWLNGNRWVVLFAEMQSGKTGVMRYLAWLLNDKGEHGVKLRTRLGLQESAGADGVVEVIQHTHDNDLREQTKRELGPLSEGRAKASSTGASENPIVPEGNIIHGQNLKTKNWKKSGKAIFFDESHFGSAKDHTIPKDMEEKGIPLHVDLQSMEQRKTFVLSVSATPFTELEFQERRAIVKLKAGANYYSAKDMSERRLLFNNKDFTEKSGKGISWKPCETIVTGLQNYLMDARKDKTGLAGRKHDSGLFMFIRIITRENCKGANMRPDMIRSFGRKGFRVLEYDSANEKKEKVNLDKLLLAAPKKDTVIFIKNYLKTGKQLNTTHVGVVMDMPLQSKGPRNVDTVVQGLVGRCCGYNKKEHNVRVITDQEEVESYINSRSDFSDISEIATNFSSRSGTDKSAHGKP
eukprot:g4818.t1